MVRRFVISQGWFLNILPRILVLLIIFHVKVFGSLEVAMCKDTWEKHAILVHLRGMLRGLYEINSVIMAVYEPGPKLLVLGMVIQPLIGILIMGI